MRGVHQKKGMKKRIHNLGDWVAKSAKVVKIFFVWFLRRMVIFNPKPKAKKLRTITTSP